MPTPPVPPPPRRGGRAGAVLAWALAAALVALWAVTAAGRSWSAPPVFVSAAVTFLPYLYVGLAIALFGAWTLLPDRRLLPTLLGLTGASAGLLWGPSWRHDPDESEGRRLRVMSWNVRRLWGGPGEVGNLRDVADATACVVERVEAEQPDVLALLEVSRRDVASLSSRLGLSCVHSDYLGEDDPDLGGLAACVRGHDLVIRGGPRRFVDDDPWTYVFAEIDDGSTVFNLMSVHLAPYRFDAGGSIAELSRRGEVVFRNQGDQSAALLDLVGRLHDPTVMAGDFNSTRDTALHASLRGRLVDAWERGGQGFGATVRFMERLPLRVDYVYVTPGFAVKGTRVPDVSCSDHRPIVTDLVLPGMDDRGDGAQEH